MRVRRVVLEGVEVGGGALVVGSSLVGSSLVEEVSLVGDGVVLGVGALEVVAAGVLDVLDVGQEASVAAFQSAARDLFDQIRARGRTPILVGGSGLYVRAALDVLPDGEIRGLLAELANFVVARVA